MTDCEPRTEGNMIRLDSKSTVLLCDLRGQLREVRLSRQWRVASDELALFMRRGTTYLLCLIHNCLLLHLLLTFFIPSYYLPKRPSL